MMTTLTINIEDKKAEKAVKAVLDALGLDYDITRQKKVDAISSTKSEAKLYSRLEKSVEEIKRYKEGKVELQDANDFLNEL